MCTERNALRALLRICRSADRQPERLVFLLGRPPRRYDPGQGRVMRMNAGGSLFVEDAIREAGGGSTEFAHPVEGVAAHAIRRHYRRARAMGLPYLSEARELYKRIEAASAVAFEVGAARTIGAHVLNYSTAGELGGSTAVADKIGKPLPVLERFAPGSPGKATAGDFLLAHPLSCLFESVFDQAVIMLDSTPRLQNVTGIVLNKPTGATLGQMLDRWQSAEDRQWADKLNIVSLLNAQLFRGGPIIFGNSLRESLRWLHEHGDGVEGACQVAPGVWLGGDLAEVAARCHGDLKGVRFFLGFASWSPQQLAVELECGVWVRARAPQFERVPEGEDNLSSAHALCLELRERGAAWRAAMHFAGMSRLTSFPRSSGVDRRLRGYVERIHRQMDEVEQEAVSATSRAAGGTGRGRSRSRRW